MTWRLLFSPVTLTLRILLVVCLPSPGYASHNHLTHKQHEVFPQHLPIGMDRDFLTFSASGQDSPPIEMPLAVGWDD